MQQQYRQQSARRRAQPYVYGNTARQLQEIPDRYKKPKNRRKKAEIINYQKKVKARQGLSKEAQQNRIAATSMGAGFVCFLAIMSTILIFCCIGYLQAKSELTYKIRTVANMESELETMREDNKEYEAQITANIDLEQIRRIAVSKLGMHYPTQEQKQTYDLPEQGSYVRQYIFNLDD